MLIQGGFSLVFLLAGQWKTICQNQQTRLEDHLRLQGHKSHDDELQRIRIHFHIFLCCHISCQSGIYIHLDLISPLALSLSAVSCASAGLCCSVPVKIFCIKKERETEDLNLHPLNVLMCLWRSKGRQVSSSLGFIRKERDGEQMVFYMHTCFTC